MPATTPALLPMMLPPPPAKRLNPLRMLASAFSMLKVLRSRKRRKEMRLMLEGPEPEIMAAEGLLLLRPSPEPVRDCKYTRACTRTQCVETTTTPAKGWTHRHMLSIHGRYPLSQHTSLLWVGAEAGLRM